MKRGIFEFISKNVAYKDASKEWYVEQLLSEMVWYDILVNPIPGYEIKEAITDKLKEMKRIVEEQCDKRFIYYIASRKKVRFSRKRKPRYSFFNKHLVVYLEVGKSARIKKIKIPITDSATGLIICPKVNCTDRLITFGNADGRSVSFTVHSFLSQCKIELSEATEVHYVGYTNRPWERPLNRSHRGLSDTLYSVSTEDRDIFIFYNIFKVISVAENNEYKLNFAVANSVIDEIKVDDEGSIIEKSLIYYFGSSVQELNQKNESSSLKNHLKKLSELNRITSIGFGLEIDDASEYFNFYSRNVSAQVRHEFTLKLGGDDPHIIYGESVFKRHLDQSSADA